MLSHVGFSCDAGEVARHMGLLFRDAQTGEIAYFINFWASLMLIFGAISLLALAVAFGDDTALGLVPEHWLIHASDLGHTAFSKAGVMAMDVIDQGLGSVLKILFRAGLTMCACIIVHHFATRKKRPRAARGAGASSAAGASGSQ